MDARAVKKAGHFTLKCPARVDDFKEYALRKTGRPVLFKKPVIFAGMTNFFEPRRPE